MEAGDTGPDRVVSLYFRPRNDQTEVNAPDKIRCFIGGEWKPRTEFSGRQLEKFTRSRARPANSKISCRVHSAQIRRELQCEGPCEKWLPIESFSRSTRTHGKTWCLDCTEWQLSVEPGYAPYVPPSSLEDDDDDDEDHLLEGNNVRASVEDEEPSERIEDWIQGNPSELGDYDRVVGNGTHGSAMGSASDISGPSLLDSANVDFEGLPIALNAANLSNIRGLDQIRPSYASVASTIRAPLASSDTLGRGMGQGEFSLSDTESLLQAGEQSSAPTISSGTTANASSQSQSVTSGASTAWMENEFSTLVISQPQPLRQPGTRSGWARPVQRRTDITAPRYVTNSGGADCQPQNIQKVVYADGEGDDSEDEC